MSPRKRKIHEHLPHSFQEVIEVVAKGKPKELRKTVTKSKKRKKSD